MVVVRKQVFKVVLSPAWQDQGVSFLRLSSSHSLHNDQWILQETPSSQFWHRLSEYPTSWDFSPVSCRLPQMSINKQEPWALLIIWIWLLLVLINLLQGHSEFEKPLSLHLYFCCKRYCKETEQSHGMNKRRGQDMGEGTWSFHALSRQYHL